jgi:hypothetical protein
VRRSREHDTIFGPVAASIYSTATRTFPPSFLNDCISCNFSRHLFLRPNQHLRAVSRSHLPRSWIDEVAAPRIHAVYPPYLGSPWLTCRASDPITKDLARSNNSTRRTLGGGNNHIRMDLTIKVGVDIPTGNTRKVAMKDTITTTTPSMREMRKEDMEDNSRIMISRNTMTISRKIRDNGRTMDTTKATVAGLHHSQQSKNGPELLHGNIRCNRTHVQSQGPSREGQTGHGMEAESYNQSRRLPLPPPGTIPSLSSPRRRKAKRRKG